MPTLCPECKNPPQYHSFCTRCAKLFRPARRKWIYREQIREARNALLTQKQAAEKIGVSVQTLEKYRKQFHIPPFPKAPSHKRDVPRTWTPERIRSLRRLIVAGCTPKEAADAFCTSVGAISCARQRYDLPKFLRKNSATVFWTTPRVRKLAELRAKGYSFTRAACEFGMTRDAIAGAVHRYLNEARP